MFIGLVSTADGSALAKIGSTVSPPYRFGLIHVVSNVTVFLCSYIVSVFFFLVYRLCLLLLEWKL